MTDLKIDTTAKKSPAKKKTTAAAIKPKGKLVIVESPTKGEGDRPLPRQRLYGQVLNGPRA